MIPFKLSIALDWLSFEEGLQRINTYLDIAQSYEDEGDPIRAESWLGTAINVEAKNSWPN